MSTNRHVKPSALIIDPQANMATLVADMLRTLGHGDICEADNAGQAQIELRRRAFSVIIIDDALANPDAVAVVRKLRGDASSLNRLTPIIMMAAAPDAARISAARDAGVTEFLRKPFAASHLKARLDGIAAQPRAFIEAQTYAGPDRRRKVQDIGSAERRTGPETGKN